MVKYIRILWVFLLVLATLFADFCSVILDKNIYNRNETANISVMPDESYTFFVYDIKGNYYLNTTDKNFTIPITFNATKLLLLVQSENYNCNTTAYVYSERGYFFSSRKIDDLIYSFFFEYGTIGAVLFGIGLAYTTTRKIGVSLLISSVIFVFLFFIFSNTIFIYSSIVFIILGAFLSYLNL
jgi:hypothetical protein